MIVAVGLFAALTFLGQTAQTPAYRAPRTKDGKPNLNGIWQAVNEANWNIEPHSAEAGPFYQLGAAYSQPPGLGIVEGAPFPTGLKRSRRKKIILPSA
jgi:hypothetical protein